MSPGTHGSTRFPLLLRHTTVLLPRCFEILGSTTSLENTNPRCSRRRTSSWTPSNTERKRCENKLSADVHLENVCKGQLLSLQVVQTQLKRSKNNERKEKLQFLLKRMVRKPADPRLGPTTAACGRRSRPKSKLFSENVLKILLRKNTEVTEKIKTEKVDVLRGQKSKETSKN